MEARGQSKRRDSARATPSTLSGSIRMVVYSVWALDPAEAKLSEATYKLTLEARNGGWEWAGLIGLIPDPAAVDGKPVRLQMSATDSAGHTAQDARRVTAHKPSQ